MISLCATSSGQGKHLSPRKGHPPRPVFGRPWIHILTGTFKIYCGNQLCYALDCEKFSFRAFVGQLSEESERAASCDHALPISPLCLSCLFYRLSSKKKKLDRRLRRELIFSKYDSFLFSVPVPFVRKFSP